MASLYERLSRLLLVIKFALLQRIQRNIVSIKRSAYLSPATQPDAYKTIARRTDLYQARIFKPRDSKDEPLPLIVGLHGGGFMMNNPSVDDPLSRHLADRTGSLVVALDYSKAPLNPFPKAYEDVVNMTAALLEDKDLSVDYSKVAFCAFSAGGNLALAAAQDPRLRGKMRGILAMYPLVDMTPTFEVQIARRPDPNVLDFLDASWNLVRGIYAGTTDAEKLKDRRLSPALFESRNDLPQHICIMGCEHDMLCHDAKRMAERLATQDVADSRFEKDQWQLHNVQWKLWRGCKHAFDVFPQKDPEAERKRLADVTLLHKVCSDWFLKIFEKVD